MMDKTPASGPIARRVELMRHKPPADAHGPAGRFLVGELSAWAEPVRRLFRAPLALPRTAHPRIVMLLPGFVQVPPTYSPNPPSCSAIHFRAVESLSGAGP